MTGGPVVNSIIRMYVHYHILTNELYDVGSNKYIDPAIHTLCDLCVCYQYFMTVNDSKINRHTANGILIWRGQKHPATGRYITLSYVSCITDNIHMYKYNCIDEIYYTQYCVISI